MNNGMNNQIGIETTGYVPVKCADGSINYKIFTKPMCVWVFREFFDGRKSITYGNKAGATTFKTFPLMEKDLDVESKYITIED